MMFGYIYKTTDTRNGLIYIGQHKAKRFNPFYFGSGRDICQLPYEERLIHYKVELLHIVPDTGDEEHDALELDRLEIQEIANHHSTDPKIGYNRNKGGQRSGGWYKGTKGHITLHKGNTTVRVHPDYVDLYLNDGYEYGIDDTIRKRMSEASKLAQASSEYREKQRIAQTGKKRTAESRKLLSDAANKRWQNKEFHDSRCGIRIINNGIEERRLQPNDAQALVDTGEWRYGRMKMKPHSYKLVKLYNPSEDQCTAVKESEVDEYLSTGLWRRGMRPMSKEQRDKISKLRTGKKYVTKDGINRQVNEDELQQCLNDGWHIGMTKKKRRKKDAE